MTVSPWIDRFSSYVPLDGFILDLACGTGRHGRFFLDNGHKVLFVDQNIEGLSDLAAVKSAEILQCDLEDGRDWPFEREQFSAIVVTNYLYRPHLSFLAPALKQGGVLLYETFAQGNEQFGRPRNPDFLLRPHELLEVAQKDGMNVIAFEQGQEGDKVIQRLCAVKGRDTALYHL
ncbi:MAG: class I SAM-dependent methyltransferase [Terasakiella sp.]|uniref:class I SAM-dependent methyltransferase n=1 Tax=unclassified Terasakiella TaxID=2614952 RepID=UPI003AFFC5BC